MKGTTWGCTGPVGGHIEMPWDTYLPTPDAQRYFGNPADDADAMMHWRREYEPGWEPKA